MKFKIEQRLKIYQKILKIFQKADPHETCPDTFICWELFAYLDIVHPKETVFGSFDEYHILKCNKEFPEFREMMKEYAETRGGYYLGMTVDDNETRVEILKNTINYAKRRITRNSNKQVIDKFKRTITSQSKKW